MIDTVPKAIDAGIVDFCASISDAAPVFIPSLPPSDAQEGFCFDNSAREAARHGGEAAFGWAIWHLRGAYYEAEHHGVWRKAGGQLVDVSPQLNGFTKILFLPDDGAIYNPANFRPNRFWAENNSADAVELVEACKRNNAILNSYRGLEIGPITLSDEDQAEADSLFARIETLTAKIAG